MRKPVLVLGALVIVSLATGAALDRRSKLPGDVDRGRYLVRIAGCNDCHTAGYAISAGKVDEKQWLTGDALGWRGPWGTTYASNLRLLVQNMTEDQFLNHARSDQGRPPMPWFNVRDMTDDDVKAIYAYIKHLGPGGKPAPTYLPPGQEPKGPFIMFPAD
jgi:mono/diheme cytochrome c family protein